MSATSSPGPGLARLAATAGQIQAERPPRLRDALELIQAALEAVDPEAATVRALDGLHLGFENVTVVALGKAAPAMARGAARALDTRARSFLVVTDHDERVPEGTELIVSSHPLPDARSLTAGQRLLEVVRESEFPILFLISGGGSALAEVPERGLGLTDVAASYRAMLLANVGIDEANVVRAHISRIKGGRLAAAASSPVATILISDVGPHPHLVASGPTLPCTSDPHDALEVIHRHRLDVPPAVIATLTEGLPAPRLPEAPVVMAADGQMAAEAAVEAGKRRELPAFLLTTSLHGEARGAMRAALSVSPIGEIAVLAGETTVEVRGDGRGGRNQEAALAAATEIAGTPWSVLTFGTDGIDGPTDAAGAYVDGATSHRLGAAGIDVDDALERNDSYSALGAVDALIRIGPTGANVADLWIVDRRED